MSHRTNPNELDPIRWDNDTFRLYLLDQTKLPAQIVTLECSSVQDVWNAIVKLGVRGAPAIGIAAAYGVCLACRSSDKLTLSQAKQQVEHAINHLASSRPTAVNLFWALDRMRSVAAKATEIASLASGLIAEADEIHSQDRELCEVIGKQGALRLGGLRRFLTHCNAGSLATGGTGTALAPLYALHRQGIAIHVYADETRPLLQGSRLTAWELARAGVPVTVITDSMAGSVLRAGKVDAVIVGADRITARGDVANKIGTYPLAVLANYHKVPFFVAAPHSTFDLSLVSGDEIPIEERNPKEILGAAGWTIEGVKPEVFNPAFDVTPAELVTAIVTDLGVIESPSEDSVRAMIGK